MAVATRTQIYLTVEQRKKLDELARRDDRPLAAVIRDAVDEFLDRESLDPERALSETFGVAPDFEVPSRDEWEERERRIWSG